jgi:hypothetical protein
MGFLEKMPFINPASEDPEARPEKKAEKPTLRVETRTHDNSIEAISLDFKEILDGREAQYDRDIEANPKMEAMRSNLEVHNAIVLGYSTELIDNMDLSDEDRAAAIIATMEHDSGKLASELLEHHTQGMAYAETRLDELIGQEVGGVKVTPDIKQKVLEAIERHMNHPFLVMLNKGERFPEPQDDVDRVVFDADMMANAGFKNVAFRLSSENFLDQDAAKAKENGTAVLKESFENVIQGVRALPETVLSDQAQEITTRIVASVDQIMEYFDENDLFTQLQTEFSDSEGNFNMQTIAAKGGFSLIKKRINEEILKAGSHLDVDPQYLQNFQM